MTFRYLIPLAVVLASPAVQAHEVWIERDGNGLARIYLGEPGEVLPDGGDPEFDHLKTPTLLPASKATMARKAGYLEVTVPAGDVRAQDDTVFAPWGPDDKKEGVAYFARAGRSDPKAVMPFEIAPVSAGGDRFMVVRDGKPAADTEVTVISPEKWTKVTRTDAQGTVTVPLREKGRYILVANQKDESGGDTTLGKVAVLHRISTTTFVAE